MKHIIYSIISFCFLTGSLLAQPVYSYVSDRKFKDPSDLLGYNFKPFRWEIKDEKEENIAAGSYSFGVTQSNLYVDGKDIKGVYSINNINPTKYGYQLVLMNARNPALQGHLKVILNPKKQVEALIFKRSNKEKEIIFHLPSLSDEQRIKEEQYYTDKNELIIENADSIWGRTIKPFLVSYKENGIQDKLLPTDSVIIKFETRTTIIEKKVKQKQAPKPKKEKKTDKKEDVEVKEDSKLKEDEDKVVKEESKVKENDDKVVKEEPKLKENEDKEETDKDSDKVIIDSSVKKEPESLEKKYPDSNMGQDSVLANEAKKVKIIKQNYALVRFRIKYDDGTSENKKAELKINKVTMKEDAQAGPEDEKYQITVTPTSGSPFYIYLTADKAVNSIEFPDKKYWVRGN